MTDGPRIRVSRVLPAPRERVFHAWTDAESLKRWWGPGLFTTPEAFVDLRPGGRYSLVMQPADGERLRLAGTYLEIEPPARLVYTWRWEAGVPDTEESLVTAELTGVKRTLMGRMVAKTMASEVGSLGGLKDVLES